MPSTNPEQILALIQQAKAARASRSTPEPAVSPSAAPHAVVQSTAAPQPANIAANVIDAAPEAVSYGAADSTVDPIAIPANAPAEAVADDEVFDILEHLNGIEERITGHITAVASAVLNDVTKEAASRQAMANSITAGFDRADAGRKAMLDRLTFIASEINTIKLALYNESDDDADSEADSEIAACSRSPSVTPAPETNGVDSHAEIEEDASASSGDDSQPENTDEIAAVAGAAQSQQPLVLTLANDVVVSAEDADELRDTLTNTVSYQLMRQTLSMRFPEVKVGRKKDDVITALIQAVCETSAN